MVASISLLSTIVELGLISFMRRRKGLSLLYIHVHTPYKLPTQLDSFGAKQIQQHTYQATLQTTSLNETLGSNI